MLEGSLETVVAPPMKSWGLSPLAVASWELAYRVPVMKQADSSDPSRSGVEVSAMQRRDWRLGILSSSLSTRVNVMCPFWVMTSGFQVKLVCFISPRRPIPHAFCHPCLSKQMQVVFCIDPLPPKTPNHTYTLEEVATFTLHRTVVSIGVLQSGDDRRAQPVSTAL